MADRVINVTVSNVNTKNVAVSSKQVANEISATADSSIYYSQLAKNWAIGEGLIQNEDYSSKTYAGVAQEAAESAQGSADTAQAFVNDFSGVVDNAITEIDGVKTEALTAVTSSKDLALSDISATQSSALTEIGDLKNSSLTEISASLENATGNITDAQSNAVEAVSTLGDNYISNINTTGNKYIADIGNAGENYIDNINATGKGYDNLTHRQITNCLLEVPQRIKYELVDGTLTIKAGSVVIVPYGIEDLTAQYPVGSTFLNDYFKVVDTQYEDGKFFVWAELQSDTSTTGFHDGQITILIHADSDAGIVTEALTSDCTSGTTNPAKGIYYNTTSNTLCRYTNSVADMQFTLPLGIGTRTSGVITSVNQVFNGMGYIGSTVWLDKGVKCLIPNGRNADGSLNNLEVTNDNLLTTTFTSTENMSLVYQPYSDESKYKLWNRSAAKFYYQAENPGSVAIYSQWYNTAENQWYTSENTNSCTFKKYFVVVGYQDCTDGVISNFKPRTAFQAVDYNDFCRLNAEALRDSDKVTITRWAMPSGTTKTLTLGTSGTKYTAPADGYFSICGELTKAVGYVDMSCNGVKIKCNAQNNGTDCNIFVPAKKGATCMVQYLNFGLAQSYQSFVFVYAEGAV